jgi:hypothetical protein
MNSTLIPPAGDAWRHSVESIEKYMLEGSVRLNTTTGEIVESGGM